MNADHQAFALTAVKTVAFAGVALGALVLAAAAAMTSQDDDEPV